MIYNQNNYSCIYISIYREDKWSKKVLSEIDIVDSPLENELSPSSQLRKSLVSLYFICITIIGLIIHKYKYR